MPTYSITFDFFSNANSTNTSNITVETQAKISNLNTMLVSIPVLTVAARNTYYMDLAKSVFKSYPNEINRLMLLLDGAVIYEVNADGIFSPNDVSGSKQYFNVVVGDETTNLAVATGVRKFRVPYAFNLLEVRAEVSVAPTGAALVVDINSGGNSIFGTNKLSIPVSTSTSVGATAPDYSTKTFADNNEFVIDIDQVGSSVAGKGLKITLIGYLT